MILTVIAKRKQILLFILSIIFNNAIAQDRVSRQQEMPESPMVMQNCLIKKITDIGEFGITLEI